MILRPLQPAEAFYRFNTPRWSYRPTSGAGAAKVGGRFNRPGLEALYLSRSVQTASAEYQQDEPLMPPGTLVTYRIALSQVVDLQKGYVRGEWDELWADWHCEWRKLALYEEIEAAQLVVRRHCDRARLEGHLVSIDTQRRRKQRCRLHAATR